jgi:hypothetical protein
MKRRGSITLTCLGCLGLLVALAVLGLLKGCSSVSGQVPLPDPQMEFSVRGGDYRLEVSRPRGMARLQNGGRSAIYSLQVDVKAHPGVPPGPGWLLDDKSRTFVRVDAQRLQKVGGGQEGLGSRLLEVWKEWGEEDNRRFLSQVLPPHSQLGGQLFQGESVTVLRGGAWQEQPTSQLTFARRVKGSGVIALPVGWKYYLVAYAPGPGLVLNAEESDRKPGSVPDEALFVNTRLTDFKVEHFAADRFRPPTDYRERYSDQELSKDTPRTPFYQKPPRDYGQIGTTSYSTEQGVTLIREEFLQKGSAQRRWMFEIFVYLLDRPDQVEPLVEKLRLGWLGFQGWDARPLAPEATAVLKSGFLLRKKNRLIRLDLKYFKRGDRGQHDAKDDPEARSEMQTLARELSQGLP